MMRTVPARLSRLLVVSTLFGAMAGCGPVSTAQPPLIPLTTATAVPQSVAIPVLYVTFDGAGTWEEEHPQLAGAPTKRIGANVSWTIVYRIGGETVTTLSADVTGNGYAEHADSDPNGTDIVCTGAIEPFADRVAAGQPTLDLVDAWPSFPDHPIAHFRSQAMGGSAYHLCDPAWATGIHTFPSDPGITGDAPLEIDFGSWVGREPHTSPAEIVLSTPAKESLQETVGGPPATLKIDWHATYVVSNQAPLPTTGP